MHDVTEPYMSKVDEIYNVACPETPSIMNNPIKTRKNRVMSAINMLGLVKKVNVKILQSSTNKAYDDPAVYLQPES